MFKETYYSKEVEFEASVSLESNNLLDPYGYQLREGRLFSPVTKTFVEEEITRRDSIEEAEYQAFRVIQAWFSQNEQGMVVWISPKTSLKEDYDASKIIFSKILPETPSGKLLRNRSLRLDWGFEECLLFAKKIGFSEGNLRATPIFLGPEINVENLLEPYFPGLGRIIGGDEDFIIKENLKAKIAAGYPAPIGAYSLSCGPRRASAFNLFYADSLSLNENYFDCPRCHQSIPSGRGITTCPHCGAKKEDYAGGCD